MFGLLFIVIHFIYLSIYIYKFYEAIITLIPKPDKDNTQKKKIQANFNNEHRCNNPQQNTSKPNPTIY